jgi:hypothetical protein
MTKKTLPFKITILLLFALSFNNSQAQIIDSLLDILDTKYVQEKIYMQMDKSYYNAGETIWFKAYLSADNLPGPISKTLYAELIDEKGMILQQKMMPIIQSGASSNFDLPDSVNYTKLYIRAYTTWMLNFDSSLLYLKPIQIIPNKTLVKKTAIPVIYSLQFFPEGGDLVNNISSRVAFKATDNQGTPFEVKGDIIDSKGKKITTFSSVHDGMGYLTLQPIAKEKYHAVWKDKKGLQHETLLPEANKIGIVLSTELSDFTLNYTIKRPDSVDAVYSSYQVEAQMHQRLVYSAKVNMTKKTMVTAKIDIDSLPNGVLQLTIFNAALQPIAERIVFINHNNYYFITDIHSADKSLAKRGRNSIQIDVGDSLISNLSVSVTDADLNPISKNEESIYSNLLLSSDLKGYVYNSAYYFSGEADSVKQHLDLVMMTNGWRRFKWVDILSGNWPKIKFIPEDRLFIKGQILGLSKSMLFQKELTGILKTKNGGSNIFSMPVTSQGEFSHEGLYFFDTAKLYYQLNNDKDKTLTNIASFAFRNNIIKSPFQPISLLSGLYLPEKVDSSVLQKSSSMANLLRDQNERNKIRTLDNIVVKSFQKSAKQKLDEEYTSGFFAGGDGYVFSTENDAFAMTASTVLAYLQGKVPGLQINTVGEGSASWRGSPTSFFVNEMTTDLSRVQVINMNDVAMIKIFRPPFYGAVGGGTGGAIAIYTKKGGSDYSQLKGLAVTNVNGYSIIKQFYSPDYEKKPETDVNDYRATLYWNPNLHFDKNTRRVTVPFYNSDFCKKIRVTVEGINEFGQLTREEKIIQ